MSRVAASIKEQEKQETAAENGAMSPVNAQTEILVQDQDGEDIKSELYDEINSLYNMDNPKGDDADDRKSQFSS